MKTIAVSDEAYGRLASWKEGRGDSFTKVILRVVPAKGQLDSVLAAADGLPKLGAKKAARLEQAVGEGHAPLGESWS